MEGTEVLDICHPRLTNLTLEYTPSDIKLKADIKLKESVNVVAPELKSLTMKYCFGEHVISAPGLTSLVIEGDHLWQLSTPQGFHSLEKADLFMHLPRYEDAHELVCLIQQFHSVKLLTLNWAILKCLFSERSKLCFSRMEPHSSLDPYKACVFANANIIKFTTIMPVYVYLEVQPVSPSTEVKNYDTSPSAIFPMISHEEITAMFDIALAQIFVEILGLFVNGCRANTNSDTNKADMDEQVKVKPQVEMHRAWELQSNLGEILKLIEHREIVALETSRMMAHIKGRYIGKSSVTRPIVSWLQEVRELFEQIEQLITQMSSSKRAVMLPVFSNLCEDAAILTDALLGWIKIII